MRFAPQVRFWGYLLGRRSRQEALQYPLYYLSSTSVSSLSCAIGSRKLTNSSCSIPLAPWNQPKQMLCTNGCRVDACHKSKIQVQRAENVFGLSCTIFCESSLNKNWKAYSGWVVGCWIRCGHLPRVPFSGNVSAPESTNRKLWPQRDSAMRQVNTYQTPQAF